MLEALQEMESKVIPYEQGFAIAAYNTVDDVFKTTGKLTEENVPLEFIAIAREGFRKFFAENSASTVADFTELDIPDKEAMPDVMRYIAGVQTKQGGYKLFDKFQIGASEGQQMGKLLDIDITIPPADNRVGDIPDMDATITNDNARLPVAILSNTRLDQMQSAIQSRYQQNV